MQKIATAQRSSFGPYMQNGEPSGGIFFLNNGAQVNSGQVLLPNGYPNYNFADFHTQMA